MLWVKAQMRVLNRCSLSNVRQGKWSHSKRRVEQKFLSFPAWSIGEPHNGDSINYWGGLPWVRLFIFRVTGCSLKTFRLCHSFTSLTISLLFTCQKLLCLVLPKTSVLIQTHDQREGGNALNSLGKVIGKNCRIIIDIHSVLVYTHLTLSNSGD
jgi:hypothetical protein